MAGQLLEPVENGINAVESLCSFVPGFVKYSLVGSKRSGINLAGSCHWVGLWWQAAIEKIRHWSQQRSLPISTMILVPLGMYTSQILMSSYVLYGEDSMVGGFILMTSLTK